MTNFNEFAVSASMAESKAIIIVNGKQFPAKIKNITHNGPNDPFSSPETLIEAEVYDRTPYHQLFRNMDISSLYPRPSTNCKCVPNNLPTIKNVIFRDPATIVFWTDGTKTVVKVQKGEVFDPEKGLAMAMCKRLAGDNKGNFNEIFKKWVPEEKKDVITPNQIKDGISSAPVTGYFEVPVEYSINTILTQFLATHPDTHISRIKDYRRSSNYRNAIVVTLVSGLEVLYLYDETLDRDGHEVDG